MRPLAEIAALLLVLLALAPGARAQAPVRAQIDTNLPGAVLYADDVRIGPVVDGAVVSLPPGTEGLRLLPPDADSWSIEPVAASVAGLPGDTVRVALRFPYHYRVQSVPYAAAVFVETSDGRRRLGETPLVYEAPAPLGGTLVVERPGYLEERVAAGGDVWNRVDVVLTPMAPMPETAHEVSWEPPSRRLGWIDYAAIGTALGAGALAVHYKFKADRLYDRYADTTDPALRPDIDAYDTRAGIALGVMQVGVGAFALRLVLR